MKLYRLTDMKKGWFVGDFEPTAFKTKSAEVALRFFKQGEETQDHYHKVATEVNLVVDGIMLINGKRMHPGSIFVLEPGERSHAVFEQDTVLVIFKEPSAKGDKYAL